MFALAAPVTPAAPAALVARAADNPVTIENRLPGTTAWQGHEEQGTAVEGYASEVSVLPGEQIHLHVSTDPGAAYEVQVYRLGWYGGLGGRLVADSENQGVPQPETADENGAAWPVTDTVSIPADAVSGYFLVRMVLLEGRDAGRAAQTIVIVRAPPARQSQLLVQVPVDTWQAYNGWGGHSLYDSTSSLGRVNRVSFLRPYAPGYLQTFEWEIQLVRFLEREGYDVSYQTDVDTQRDPGSLLDHRLVVVAGHDEYWTSRIRDAFDAARDAGTNLAFMGSNVGYWQIRYENAESTIVSYKSTADPDTDPAQQTVQFRQLTPPRPECALVGVQWEGGLESFADAPRGYTVVAPSTDPWLRGTGLVNGSVLPGIVGPEWDTQSCSVPGAIRLFHYEGAPANADAVRYTAASGARVFSSGSMQFAWGLDDFPPYSTGVPNPVLPGLQQFMRNALDDLGRPAPPRSVTARVSNGRLVFTVDPGPDARIASTVVSLEGHVVCRLPGPCSTLAPAGHRTYEYSAVDVDRWAESAPLAEQVTVPNSRPRVSILARGRIYLALAKDRDGDRLAYRWSLDSRALATRTRRLVLTAAPGRHLLRVVVADGHGGRATASRRVVVSPPGRSGRRGR
jgi:N,N-dimethylformamidase beta subunit-like protein